MATLPGIASLAATTIINNVFNNDPKPAAQEGPSNADIMEKLEELIAKMQEAGGPSQEAVVEAFQDKFGQAFVEGLKAEIEKMDSIPQAKKDEIYEALDATLANTGIDTPQEVEAVEGLITDIAGDAAKEELEEVLNNTGGTTGSTSGKGGKDGAEEGQEGGSGNWLVDLAKAMAQTAGKHLQKMIDLNKEVGALEIEMDNNKAEGGTTDGATASEFLEKTSMMQAHTQMFKMMQEALTTVVKSVGEALSSTVRKQ